MNETGTEVVWGEVTKKDEGRLIRVSDGDGETFLLRVERVSEMAVFMESGEKHVPAILSIEEDDLTVSLRTKKDFYHRLVVVSLGTGDPRDGLKNVVSMGEQTGCDEGFLPAGDHDSRYIEWEV